MNCRKCGFSINENDVFCGNCGEQVEKTLSTNDSKIGNQNNSTENLSSFDEELLEAYIGKNYNKLIKQDFSVNTFFFGIFYIIYRKMWLLSIALFVASMILSIFLPFFSGYIIGVINIVLSFQFKKLYIKHAKEEVEKIKNRNIGCSDDELISICRKKGGTSVGAIILYIIIYILIIAIEAIVLFGQSPKIVGKWISNDGKILSLESDDTYILSQSNQGSLSGKYTILSKTDATNYIETKLGESSVSVDKQNEIVKTYKKENDDIYYYALILEGKELNYVFYAFYDKENEMLKTVNVVDNTIIEFSKMGSEKEKVANKKTIEKMVFEVPSSLNMRDYSSDNYLSMYEVDMNCSIAISAFNNYLNKTAKEDLQENVFYTANDKVHDYTTKKISSMDWDHVIVEKEYITEYYYSVVYDNYIYNVQYNLYGEENLNCKNGFDGLINSIKFN